MLQPYVLSHRGIDAETTQTHYNRSPNWCLIFTQLYQPNDESYPNSRKTGKVFIQGPLRPTGGGHRVPCHCERSQAIPVGAHGMRPFLDSNFHGNVGRLPSRGTRDCAPSNDISLSLAAGYERLEAVKFGGDLQQLAVRSHYHERDCGSDQIVPRFAFLGYDLFRGHRESSCALYPCAYHNHIT